MTHDEMIAIIQAAKDGKKIQVRTKNPLYGGVRKWANMSPKIQEFNFNSYEYRVAPEVREYTLVLNGEGKVLGGALGRPMDGQVLAYKSDGKEWGIHTVHVREVVDNG